MLANGLAGGDGVVGLPRCLEQVPFFVLFFSSCFFWWGFGGVGWSVKSSRGALKKVLCVIGRGGGWIWIWIWIWGGGGGGLLLYVLFFFFFCGVGRVLNHERVFGWGGGDFHERVFGFGCFVPPG